MVKKVEGSSPQPPSILGRRTGAPSRGNPLPAPTPHSSTAKREFKPGDAKQVNPPRKINAKTSQENEFDKFIDKDTLKMNFEGCSASVHKLKDRVEILIDHENDYMQVMTFLIREKKMFFLTEDKKLHLTTSENLPVKIVIGR